MGGQERAQATLIIKVKGKRDKDLDGCLDIKGKYQEMAVLSQQAGLDIVGKVEFIIIDQTDNSFFFFLNNIISSRFNNQAVDFDLERDKVVTGGPQHQELHLQTAGVCRMSQGHIRPGGTHQP